jgi:hypothetical protein
LFFHWKHGVRWTETERIIWTSALFLKLAKQLPLSPR